MRIGNLVNKIISDNTGQPIDKVKKDTDRDNFMTAQQSVDYGLVDAVIDSRD